MNGPTRRQWQAIALLLVVSLVFVTLDFRSGAMSGVRSGTEAVFGPVQRGLTAVFAPVGRFFAGIPDIGHSNSRIKELERQNADLRRQLRESPLTGTRAAELQRLGLLAGAGQLRVVPAAVVSLGPSLGFEWAITIDVGSKDGVKPDMTVINGDGLVGRIKQVSSTSSVVVLLTDPESAVGVRIAGSNQLGLASGTGLRPLSFSALDPQSGVQVGDRLLTGPYGGSTYVAGIPVGQVISVSGDDAGSSGRDATIQPYVSVSSLDLVGVILTAPRTDPRDSLLPVRAAASSAASASVSPRPAATPTAGASGSAGTSGTAGTGSLTPTSASRTP